MLTTAKQTHPPDSLQPPAMPDVIPYEDSCDLFSVLRRLKTEYLVIRSMVIMLRAQNAGPGTGST